MGVIYINIRMYQSMHVCSSISIFIYVRTCVYAGGDCCLSTRIDLYICTLFRLSRCCIRYSYDDVLDSRCVYMISIRISICMHIWSIYTSIFAYCDSTITSCIYVEPRMLIRLLLLLDILPNLIPRLIGQS